MFTGLLWFRSNLRIADNPVLLRAASECSSLMPIFVWNPAEYEGQTEYGFAKFGIHRRRFLIQALLDLRSSLRLLGNDLFVAHGKPAEVFRSLSAKVANPKLYCVQHPGFNEQADLLKVQQVVPDCHLEDDDLLYALNELPFTTDDLPNVFTKFRVAVEKKCQPSKPAPSPQNLPPPPELKIDASMLWNIPNELDAGFAHEPRSAMEFIGGEQQAWLRLKDYLWESEAVRTYKQTRNGLIGRNYSSKLSPWLANGCITSRQIIHELKLYEAARGGNESTYWLFFELLWREYFRLLFYKYPREFFQLNGIGRTKSTSKRDLQGFETWRAGQTGLPFVDANMRELLLTGFMSNRGRQNVASFLCKALGLDWRLGAQYFEAQLIDYDVCSNWGNWAYVAGVGNDPREGRMFNIYKQADDYDSDGEYVKIWIPELARLPGKLKLRPHTINPLERELYGFTPGVDYPQPILNLECYGQHALRRL